MVEILKTKFHDKFGQDPAFIVRAPGRINLIGEHTDYNKGFVFPAAINAYIYLAFVALPKSSNVSRVAAYDLVDEASIDLSNLKRTDKTWLNYLLGILDQFDKQGTKLLNFQCLIMGDLPIGSGMSSSSALDVGFALGMNHINDLGLSKLDLAYLSQKANHEFQGVKGGIMDQYSILFGKRNKAMLLDCRSLEASFHSCELKNYEWVLINSMVTHDNSLTAYNRRVEECTSAINKISSHNEIQYDSLRNLSLPQLNESRFLLTEIEFQRASFVLKENARVHKFAEALKNNEAKKLGKLLYESHRGLRDEYEVSCTELDLIVELTYKEEAILGSRMMGGGFGGCTINLVEKGTRSIVEKICSSYEKETKFRPEAYFIEITDGAIIL